VGQQQASQHIITRMENSPKPVSDRRRIRSYVLRTGRLTSGQQRALDELWPVYGIPDDTGTLDLANMFGNTAPVNLEIGFGNGENLVRMAAAAPAENFIGAEVHEPGIGHCLMQINNLGLENVRVARQDAVEFLERRLVDCSLDRVNLFFPDPWHKKRHHKRRIVQRAFLELLHRKLKTNGIFHVATDWPDYAEHIAATLATLPDFVAMREAPADRITTKFDARGQRLGHQNSERAWCKRSKLPSSG
jgi:tRNA (guanine-N7-)-methyltransferase